MTVYCRERYAERSYRGVHLLCTFPTIRHKYPRHHRVILAFLTAQRPVFALRCPTLLQRRQRSVHLGCHAILGMPVALNVDGLERHRKKWNALAKTWYRWSEWMATWMPSVVVTDAQAIADYYRKKYRRESVMIPYGAELEPVATDDVLGKLGLERRKYFLFVSRMEPENNGLLVRESFERVATAMKLALVGDAPYAADYIAKVHNTDDPRVVIPGAIYGQGYRELGSHCFAYIHATEVGGTHPALIEAMGRCALTLYLDTPENAEVAEGAGLPFTHHDLARVIEHVLGYSEDECASWRARAMERVRSRYSWEAVTDAYERLLKGLAKG